MEDNNIPSEMIKPWIAARRKVLDLQRDRSDAFDAGAIWAARYCAEICEEWGSGKYPDKSRAATIRHAFGLTKEPK
jgi:hypothetical protein